MKTIQDVTPVMVLKAYSGKAGACMCGCKGHYWYNPAARDEAHKDCSYLTDEDFNAAQVTKTLRVVQANEESVDPDTYGDTMHYYVEVGHRAYCVYLTADATTAMMESCSKEGE